MVITDNQQTKIIQLSVITVKLVYNYTMLFSLVKPSLCRKMD